MKKFIKKYIQANVLPLTLVVGFFVFVFNSNPFFKLPYDMWEMIMRIESIFYTGKDFSFFSAFPPAIKYHLWPWCWAKIFKFLNISDPFAWPYIIHVTQTLILSAALFFFCWLVFSILLPKNRHNFILAFSSMLFWLVGTGTFSVQYQQAWIMWYSVNYQCISMAILWLCLGMTLLVLYKDLSIWLKLILCFSTAGLFVLALFFHSMEMGFYLMFLGGILVFKLIPSWNRIISWVMQRKRHKISKKAVLLCVATVSVLCCILALGVWIIDSKIIYIPWSDNFTSLKSISDLYRFINLSSGALIRGINRFPSSFSELALISIICAAFLCWKSTKIKMKYPLFNQRLFYALFFLASLFCLIPVVPGLNGLFALLTKTNVVYRFFYVSPWFIFIPMGIYLLLDKNGKKDSFHLKLFSFISASLLVLIIGSYLVWECLALFSKKNRPPLFGNVISIVNSLDKDKVGCQYSEDDITKFKTFIKNAEKKKKSQKKAVFYIRGDWVPFLACMPGKEVFAFNRLQVMCPPNIDSSRYYRNYEVINIDLPADFPRDENMFKAFPGLEKPNDRVVNVEKEGRGWLMVDGKRPRKTGDVASDHTVNSFVQSIKYVSRIARIQLLLENNANCNDTDIILKIKETPNSKKSVAEVKINASIINKKGWYTFKFPKYLYLNYKKTYYLTLESSGTASGKAIRIYISDGTEYKYGDLYINGKKADKDLCMKIWKGY